MFDGINANRDIRGVALGLLILVAALCVIAGGVWFEHNWRLTRQMLRADPESLLSSKPLKAYTVSLGRTVFVAHCAVCHGAEGRGNATIGAPDLTGSSHIYGQGTVNEIEDIVRHGIRAGDRRGRNFAYMPAFASQRPYDAEPIPPLSPADVRDVVQFLAVQEGRPGEPQAAARGQAIFGGRGGCWDCHGSDGKGDPAIGAPNLVTGKRLYGDGSNASLAHSIEAGRHGYSPAFARTLDAAETRAVSVYVAALSVPKAGAASDGAGQ